MFLLLLVAFVISVLGVPSCDVSFDPNGPLIPCCKLSPEFYSCTTLDCTSNDGESVQVGSRLLQCPDGCKAYGTTHWGSLPTAPARCEVLAGIDCSGEKVFIDEEYPCQKWNGYYFPTAMMLSVFLGWIGADRLYLGYYAVGVCKLLTLGGGGVWWLVDIVLMLSGTMRPANGSSWEDGL